jgi:hypothetical protein
MTCLDKGLTRIIHVMHECAFVAWLSYSLQLLKAACPDEQSLVQRSPHVLQATRQTMLEMQTVLRTVERELPDTAAAVRLSGLELSDAIEEVSLLRYSIVHATP